ncbi:MAG: DNA-processing protein DprA [Clostridia bacterium]|nr:DNA-processing protein DprA [Clostridia bacterium]
MEFNLFKKSELTYWIWLSVKLGNQNKVFQRLLDGFGGSPRAVYNADEKALRDAACLSDIQISRLLDKRLDEAITIQHYCKSNSVGIVTYGDSLYPESLKSMKEPPILLYYMGALPNLNKRLCVSVVGTRNMTEYGMRSCYKIAYELASAGAVVVSGMALGIDSVAHAGAIGGRGTTVAVLGCGIDVIYPKQHRKLRKYICENGAVITAYHPGTPAYKNNFPERNAIISALSEGTVIVEAPRHSGALITAECAAEQSRTVYALPGSIEEPMSEGPNELIKNGAMAITGARDILEYYFENHSPLVNSVKLRQGELSSDFDMGMLDEVGIQVTKLRRGPKETPEALLKKLNSELNDNKEQNSDYYSVPKMKRIHETTATEGKQEPESAKKSTVDQSIIDTLTADERSVWDGMPCDRPVSVDEIAKSGHDVSSLIATLTLLEIKGLISTLPGGMYLRK